MLKNILKKAFFIGFLGFSLKLWAQLPLEEQVAGIRYINGGITKPESSAIQGQAVKWRLFVMMSSTESGSQSRTWAVGVHLQLLDAHLHQVIFEHASVGPLLLVDLPVGDYVLRARYEGQVQEKTLQLKKASVTRLHLHWSE